MVALNLLSLGVGNIDNFENADCNISFKSSLQNVRISFLKIGCFHIITDVLLGPGALFLVSFERHLSSSFLVNWPVSIER